MKIHRTQLPFAISAIYFAMVICVLVWYESSLGVENGGLISGLALALLTFPSVLLSGWASSLLGCTRYSTCEHVVGSLFAGSLNALLIYAALRLAMFILGNKNAT